MPHAATVGALEQRGEGWAAQATLRIEPSTTFQATLACATHATSVA